MQFFQPQFIWRKRTPHILNCSFIGPGFGCPPSHPLKNCAPARATLKERALEQLVESSNTTAEKLKTLESDASDIDTQCGRDKEPVKDNPQVAGVNSGTQS